MTFNNSQTSTPSSHTTTRLVPTVDDLAAIEPNFLPGQSIAIAQWQPHGGFIIRPGVVVDFDFTQFHLTVFNEEHDAQPVILPIAALVADGRGGTPDNDMLTLDFADGKLWKIHPTTPTDDGPTTTGCLVNDRSQESPFDVGPLHQVGFEQGHDVVKDPSHVQAVTVGYRRNVYDGEGVLLGCAESHDATNLWVIRLADGDDYGPITDHRPFDSLADAAQAIYHTQGLTGRWAIRTMVEVPLF